MVTRDCIVTFHKNGGHIQYPSGKKIAFVNKDGVFFVALNVLPPNCQDAFGTIIPETIPGFARPGM